MVNYSLQYIPPQTPSTHMHTHPHNHNKRSFPRRSPVLPALPFGSVCGPGSCFSSPPLFSVRQHRGGESSAARKQNKTMESVRHSKANGFTAASSPPSLFMCKSIHRVLMAPAMHDTDSFKWPRKKMRIFHTPAELAENNSGGLY